MKEARYWQLRLATIEDATQIKELILNSSFEIQIIHYTKEQIESAMGQVFGVDEQLIEDGTYYVVESGDRIVGCGGWSYRKSLYGGDEVRNKPDPKLNPDSDPARIRAFFVDPGYARQGIGTKILEKCEEAIREAGFSSVEISATLAGEKLYSNFGYTLENFYMIPLKDCEDLEVVKMTKFLGK